MTTISKNIRNLRLSKGLTQDTLAQELKLARTSYVSIEKGTRDISLGEAEGLSRVLGVTVEEIYERANPDYPKYLEMILQLLHFISGDGKVPKTKLAKLLYLADFAWFYEELESMSGMVYRKNHFGPVPDQFFRAIDELEDTGLVSLDRKSREGREMLLISLSDAGKRKALTKLTKKEITLMKKIEKKWQKASTKEIVSFTHAQKPYFLAFDGGIISYALITQENPDHVY